MDDLIPRSGRDRLSECQTTSWGRGTMLGWWNTPAAVMVATAVVIAASLTAMARPLARQTGFLDRPDAKRKKHKEPTPLLGGVAVYLAFVLTYSLARLAGWTWLDATPEASHAVRMIFVSAGLFCLVGVWDDKVALRPRVKLLLQIVACLPFVLFGRSIGVVHLFGHSVGLGVLGAAFTIFWLVACSNVVNLADGLDGLAGTTGLIICLGTAGISAMAELYTVAGVALIYAGCLAGFLLHNWPPARIFLGDAGSLQIGFVVGALAIESSMKKAAGFALAVPLVLLSVPVFDTCMAIVRRKLTGRSIGDADRGHIHHRLQDRGLSRLQVLLALSGLSVAMAIVTFASVYWQSDVVALASCVVLLGLLIAGRIFGDQETRLFFRHVQAVNQLVNDATGLLRTRMFLARFEPEFALPTIDYWSQVTRYVRKMGGLKLELVHWDESTDTIKARLDWQRDGRTFDPALPVWQFSYSVLRAGNVRATVIASGRAREELRGQRLIDLFRLFEALCENWSSETVAERAAAEPPSQTLLPMRMPVIVPSEPPTRRAA